MAFDEENPYGFLPFLDMPPSLPCGSFCDVPEPPNILFDKYIIYVVIIRLDLLMTYIF
jgi:hypothetical protein